MLLEIPKQCGDIRVFVPNVKVFVRVEIAVWAFTLAPREMNIEGKGNVAWISSQVFLGALRQLNLGG